MPREQFKIQLQIKLTLSCANVAVANMLNWTQKEGQKNDPWTYFQLSLCL